MLSKTLLTLLLLLAAEPAAAVRKPSKRAKKAAATSGSQFAQEAKVNLTFSITITPDHATAGVEHSDEDRMEAVAAILSNINADYLQRVDDGQVVDFGFARERGELEGNAHVQGIYTITTTAHDPREQELIRKAEIKHLKLLCKAVTNIRVARMDVKVADPKKKAYLYGYVQKDTGRSRRGTSRTPRTRRTRCASRPAGTSCWASTSCARG